MLWPPQTEGLGYVPWSVIQVCNRHAMPAKEDRVYYVYSAFSWDMMGLFGFQEQPVLWFQSPFKPGG